jgi:hypothetical protein
MSDVFLTDSQNTQYDVMNGDLLWPIYGNWSSHLTLADEQTTPRGTVTLSWLGQTLTGTILRAGDNEGRVFCLVVGGKGGLSKIVPAKMYDYQLKVQLPLQEILASVGETLSPTSTLSVLTTQLPNWTRFEGSAADLLNALADQVGALWRVLPDGTVFFGKDTWPQTLDFDRTLLWQDPTWATATFSVSTLSVLPGNRFPTDPLPISNRKMACCRYQMDPTYSRVTVWFAEESGLSLDDPLHAGLVAFIKQTMRFVDYHKTYSGKVLVQRANGTLDVVPEDNRLPPLTSVPLRTNIPGSKFSNTAVAAGTQVKITFENGDPTDYAAWMYEQGSGGKKIARVDDQVNCGTLTITAVGTGVLAGTYVDPFGATTPFTLNTSIPLKGKITTGWPNLEVGPEV